ncbi:MAG: methyltransferase domain-containing protein [Actinomycetota bacterium]
MDPAPPERSALFDAGAAALTHNAPLGRDRAGELVRFLGAANPLSAVDLCCGRGALATALAAHRPQTSVVGVDLDETAIAHARQAAAHARSVARPRFEVGEATAWTEPVDAAVCIGGAHAFDGPGPLLAHLASVVPGGRAVIGDGVWQGRPDAWCRETFGRLPDGVDPLVTLAQEHGWRVSEASVASLDEWDAFEHGWIGGVRAVGTADALAFADERAQEYERYRGVLGFAYLLVERRTPAG